VAALPLVRLTSMMCEARLFAPQLVALREVAVPKPHRDLVRRLEADAADVAGEPVGVLAHHLHGVVAVGLENPHRARRAHPVAVQEHHDLPHHLLLGPGRADPLRTQPTDP
jgi:hypothetical protein